MEPPGDITSGGASVRFDLAAEFYDETRSHSEETARATTELLATELSGRGRVLEVGVGTGLIALPLHGSGIPLAGLDISAPMVGRLVQKAGGSPPFPLVLGDATRLPFPDDEFGGVLVRWVLHLIPEWRAAVAEIVRVVRPGGVFVVSLGQQGGPWDEVRARFEELLGRSLRPVGLAWEATEELDAELASHGGSLRLLPTIHDPSDEPVGVFLDAIERNCYSWTWPVPEEERRRALEELGPWAEERFGPLDRPYRYDTEIVWRAYDLPRSSA